MPAWHHNCVFLLSDANSAEMHVGIDILFILRILKPKDFLKLKHFSVNDHVLADSNKGETVAVHFEGSVSDQDLVVFRGRAGSRFNRDDYGEVVSRVLEEILALIVVKIN